MRRYLRLGYGIALSALAFLWRRLMFRTTLIAVIGSVGKSTAKECLGAILSTRFPTNVAAGTGNSRISLAKTVLRTKFHHRYTVIEVGTKRPGAMWRASWMLKPEAVLVLAVAPMHSNRFPTLELMAAEKAQLLRRLPPWGFAVLNGEDPRVMAMASGVRYRVLTFGHLPQFDLWASDISAGWPERLSFRVHSASESYLVRTNLVGEHWANSVLAALTAGTVLDISLQDAVAAVERVQPHCARMQPAPLPSGAIMLRDECNASVTTYGPALRALKQANVPRRIAAVGDTWDSGLNVRGRFEDLGRQVAEAADFAVFIGEHGHYAAAEAARRGMKEENVRSIPELREAAAFLKTELGEGDLVLLKGQVIQHFSRVYFAQLGTVSCWKAACSKMGECDFCGELGFVPARKNS